MVSIELVFAIQEAMAAGERWQETNDPAALSTLIEAWEGIFTSPFFFQLDRGQQAQFFSMAGDAAQRRYRADRKIEDLDRALKWFRQSVECLPPEAENPSSYLLFLGSALHDRYRITNQPRDLDEAIDVFRQACAHAAPGSSDLATSLSNLGIGLRQRYEAAQKPADLDEATEVFGRAALFAADTGRQTRYLTDLGVVLKMRFEAAGRNSDLDALNDVLERLYRNTGDVSHLDNAVQFCWTAVQQIPDGSFDRLSRMDALGRALRRRHEAAGQLEDLQASIHALRAAVAAAPPGTDDWVVFRNNLANSLVMQYRLRADNQVLAEILDIRRSVVAHTPTGSPSRPGRLNNLGLALRYLYDRTGKVEDLSQAIAAFRESAGLDPAPGTLNNLGRALKARADLVRSLPDLEESIRVLSEALRLSPPGGSERPKVLVNLAESLRLRQAWVHTASYADVEEAVQLAHEAVDLTPPGSQDWPDALNLLGNCLSDRYAYLRHPADLDGTVAAYRGAVAGTPESAAPLPIYLNNLATALADRHHLARRVEDAQAACREFRRACELGLVRMPEEAMRGVGNWSRWAFEQGLWEATVEAHRYGQQSIELLMGRQLHRAEKEAWLGKIQGLSASAAYALAKLGRREEAVAVLEGGRARLLSEALEQSRHDLRRLPDLGHGDAYTRYLQASECLRALQGRETESGGAHLSNASYLDLRQQEEAAQVELAAAAAAIRQVPGYEGFLSGTPAFQDIRQAVPDGASLVYVIATQRGGLALIVHGGAGRDVGAIWLSGLSDASVREQLPRESTAAAGWLWENLMGPVAAGLSSELDSGPATGHDGEPSPRLGHLVLVPGGLLGLLPLHLASQQVESRQRCILDDFVVSYAPSAQALATARARSAEAEREGTRLLAIADPGGNLPFSLIEVQAIASHFPAGATQILAGKRATQEALVEALTGCTHVHFACHGCYEPGDVLESGLILACGDTLALREILERGFDLGGVRLAALSACDTGLIDVRCLPDEAVGLPAGFLQAGAAAVVSTLWAVDDLSTSLLMDKFYQGHLIEGRPIAWALRDAQLWLRDATADELAQRLQWASAVSGGTSEKAFQAQRYWTLHPGEQPYAGAKYWAGFFVSGG